MKHAEIHISALLSDDEWKILRLFCQRASEMAECKVLENGGASVTGKIQYHKGTGLSFSQNLPPKEQISEFLMAFRFFYLQKEPTHFLSVLSLLSRHAEKEEAREVMKIVKRQWSDSLFSRSLHVKVNDTPLTSALLLDLWFNSHYFHSDAEKASQLEVLKETISEDFLRFMLLNSVLNACLPLFKVYDALRDLIDE